MSEPPTIIITRVIIPTGSWQTPHMSYLTVFVIKCAISDRSKTAAKMVSTPAPGSRDLGVSNPIQWATDKSHQSSIACIWATRIETALSSRMIIHNDEHLEQALYAPASKGSGSHYVGGSEPWGCLHRDDVVVHGAYGCSNHMASV